MNYEYRGVLLWNKMEITETEDRCYVNIPFRFDDDLDINTFPLYGNDSEGYGRLISQLKTAAANKLLKDYKTMFPNGKTDRIIVINEHVCVLPRAKSIFMFWMELDKIQGNIAVLSKNLSKTRNIKKFDGPTI